MLCIRSHSNNPQFNLAAEEYLFKNINEDVFFLYVNTPSIVVGKHQNALAEINPSFVRENNIEVIRRLSGGGAVYHDLGNLNFSFHQTVEDTAKISFKSFNEPIVNVLNELNVPAEISKRNDIFVKEFKVSGHAEHVFRRRILSHGTLLFNANRENLSKALKNTSGSFSGKAIQSVRSKVANISDFLTNALTIEEFIRKIENYILATNDQSSTYTLTEKDNNAIEQLALEKYATWAWNFGYSPKYEFYKEQASAQLSCKINVEKGTIKAVELKTKKLSTEKIETISNSLIGSNHEYQSIKELISDLDLPPTEQEEILNCLF